MRRASELAGGWPSLAERTAEYVKGLACNGATGLVPCDGGSTADDRRVGTSAVCALFDDAQPIAPTVNRHV
jgi:hypothetical protein